VTVTYDTKSKTLSMDRTQSGKTSFSESFPCITTASVKGNVRQLRIFIDRCSIEVFDAEGQVAMTNLVFPTEPYSQLKIKGGKAVIYELK
ncbi:MAG: GH32 C-terminal domain-containing protein, partial [Prevotella sp.]|nr:GH32 C-terminal domain-containing protein [Prevotella sp.]